MNIVPVNGSYLFCLFPDSVSALKHYVMHVKYVAVFLFCHLSWVLEVLWGRFWMDLLSKKRPLFLCLDPKIWGLAMLTQSWSNFNENCQPFFTELHPVPCHMLKTIPHHDFISTVFSCLIRRYHPVGGPQGIMLVSNVALLFSLTVYLWIIILCLFSILMLKIKGGSF